MKTYLLFPTLIILINLLIIVGLEAQQNPKVIATASIFSDMAENIGGAFFDIKTIVPIGGDPHIYDPTPNDASLIFDADLIFRNGLTFEGWLDELIINSGTKAQLITITDGVKPITSKQYQDATDPHAWMDPSNGQFYLKNIKNALINLRPEHKDEIEFNYKIYSKQLKDLDIEIQNLINNIPQDQAYLITTHDAFQYFGRKYGLKLVSLLGVSTDSDVQTSDVRNVINIIKEKKIKSVFIESTNNPRLLQQIAGDNNIQIGGKLYADSLGDKYSPASTYLKMLMHNATTIANGLSKTKDLVAKKDTHHHQQEPTANNPYLLWGILGVMLFGGLALVAKLLNK